MTILDLIGPFVGFIVISALIIIGSEINSAKKWTDIFKGDGRDDK